MLGFVFNEFATESTRGQPTNAAPESDYIYMFVVWDGNTVVMLVHCAIVLPCKAQTETEKVWLKRSSDTASSPPYPPPLASLLCPRACVRTLYTSQALSAGVHTEAALREVGAADGAGANAVRRLRVTLLKDLLNHIDIL